MAKPKRRPGEVPGSIVDLIERLGGAHAFKLLELRGGTIVCVPTVAAADHPLRSLMGDEGFELLVREYRGERLELAKNDAIVRQHRYRHVEELRDQGLSYNEVAMRTNFTRRWVINIAAQAATPLPQLGLFDDYEPPRHDLVDEPAMPTAHNPFGIRS